MTTIKNIVAITWSYTNKQGEEKKQYTTIGKLIEKEDGKMSVKLDTIPTNWDWWANVYDKKEWDLTKPKTESINSQYDDNEDLPF